VPSRIASGRYAISSGRCARRLSSDSIIDRPSLLFQIDRSGALINADER